MVSSRFPRTRGGRWICGLLRTDRLFTLIGDRPATADKRGDGLATVRRSAAMSQGRQYLCPLCQKHTGLDDHMTAISPAGGPPGVPGTFRPGVADSNTSIATLPPSPIFVGCLPSLILIHNSFGILTLLLLFIDVLFQSQRRDRTLGRHALIKTGWRPRTNAVTGSPL